MSAADEEIQELMAKERLTEAELYRLTILLQSKEDDDEGTMARKLGTVLGYMLIVDLTFLVLAIIAWLAVWIWP